METGIKVFEKMNFLDPEEENKPYVDDVTVEYCQSADCTESSDEVQTIKISSRNNGVGRFLNIKTDNWSISDMNELEEIIKDFCKRAGMDYGKEHAE